MSSSSVPRITPSPTEKLRVVEVVVPDKSVAVTRMNTPPPSVTVGVPEKVPVEASKVNQSGRAPPPLSSALRVKLSPLSTSVKVSSGKVKLKGVSKGSS